MTRLNEALWSKAAQEKLLRTGRVWADTRSSARSVAYRMVSGLLAKAVRKLVRTARRVQAAGGLPPLPSPAGGGGVFSHNLAKIGTLAS